MKQPLKILTINNDQDLDKLSRRAEEIDIVKENKLMREIVSRLKDTMNEYDLISLSAPAIGYNKRIFCIKFREEIKTFINPMITGAEGITLSKETCVSIPDKTFIVPRNTNINVIYSRPIGKIESRQILGMAASIFQHEFHHLECVFISDIGLEIDKDFENATEEEKQEIINVFIDSLDLRQKDLEKEIQEDKELKMQSDAIDFMTSVYKGETKLEKVKDNS